MKTLLHHAMKLLTFGIKKKKFQENARPAALIKGIWMKKPAQQIIMGHVLVLNINHRYQ